MENEIDALEQMAHDLNEAQQKRLKKFKNDDLFWANKHELIIFEAIKTLRENSRSYHPDNVR